MMLTMILNDISIIKNKHRVCMINPVGITSAIGI
jgi:hypothetical protein